MTADHTSRLVPIETTAAIVEQPGGRFELDRLSIEAPRSDEILVRVAGVGLCHTDLVARDQVIPVPLPAVFGHEASGIVEQVGDGITDLAVGDRVVLSFASCGHCNECIEGMPAYCDEMAKLNYAGRRPDGTTCLSRRGSPVSGHFFGQSSFATYALAHRRNVVKIESSLPLELLGPLGCGIQTGAGTVLNVFSAGPKNSVAVFGGGPVGLSAVLAAVAAGCSRIALVDPMASRRAFAAELCGAEVYDSADSELQAKMLSGGDFDFTLDTSGAPDAIAAAIAVTAKRGTCALVAAPRVVGQTFPVRLGTLVQSGKVIRGVVEGDANPESFIATMLRMQAEGRFPFERLMTTYPFAKINEAIKDQHDGRCIKAVLVMDQSTRA